MSDPLPGRRNGTNLVDVLDRVLDKGLVIAGDVKISLAEVELLTIRIRLIVCSLDKAQEIGLDWWKYDRHFAVGATADTATIARLEQQVRELQRELSAARHGRIPAPRNPRKQADRRASSKAAHVSRSRKR